MHVVAPDPVRAVLNQPPPLEDYNPYPQDAALREAVAREGAGWADGEVDAFGARCGSAEVLTWGRLANEHPPVLRTHDRYGARLDTVEFHPAYHDLMRLGIGAGLAGRPWTDPRPGAHVARGAALMLRHQADEGTTCPITMTFAALPTLRLQPEIAREWEPRLLSTDYDERFRPAPDKRGATVGMAMTERQGGTDVRANVTRAEPEGRGGPGEPYRITGHKWFCSAPMSDAFLVLAQAPGGLSCFWLPRFTPDGDVNAVRLQRLKDKLGNRSNASSEVELHGAWARLVGEEGRGVATIIEMVRHTRLDCALGSAATLRRALAEAAHHAAHRHVFGRPLAEQPLMQNVLADLALESEAATAFALRLARGFDAGEAEAPFTRLATAVAKYWVTKRAAAGVAEAVECLGGNGYVEESGMPRLYRDVPVNAIWEGSGNVQCLDVLRTAQKAPEAVEAALAEIALARGGNRHLDTHAGRLARDLAAAAADPGGAEGQARRLVEALALGLQGSLLVRHAPPAVADAFCAARLGGGGLAFGTLPPEADARAVVERAWPPLA
ncbi:isovaleryl-CoA dehydrogenase [Rubrivirga sp. S365]|uniref:isovaleryl-CoA dehydrogenase n=1 Tax=Rubrivirga sp. S365 TaxID=3076080 RepID=UPI0028C744B3|nr:isovaleryl-CoA dehydrogenase [Rubrivirga sp. S365]MDT7856574.1 isovaleryl-CoA dehydrogenase [Rubrivirga sp. S365]